MSFHPLMVYDPKRFQQSERRLVEEGAPFTFTPLTARAFAGYVTLASLLQISMAFENDWPRSKLATVMLIPLPFVILFQLVRFSDGVQWGNVALWVFLVDVGLVAALGIKLWLRPPAAHRA